jgi:hypothetical protein
MAMSEWVKKELRANYTRASRRGRREAKTEPRTSRVTYLAREEALRIELTNGASITIPVALIPYLKGISPEDISAVEVLGRGGGLHWEHLDLDLSVPALVSSIFPGYRMTSGQSLYRPPHDEGLFRAHRGQTDDAGVFR